jgi:hypothetical protein
MSLLPHEILETIIIILHADSFSHGLYSCALVSQELRVLCQKRIFARISLGMPIPITCEEALQSALLRYNRFNQVISQNHQIATYVRTLQLEYLVILWGSNRVITKEEYGALFLLNHVQELTIGFRNNGNGKRLPYSWSDFGFQGLRGALASFAQRNPVESLTIIGIGNLSPGIVRKFHQLRNLDAYSAPITNSLAEEELVVGGEPASSLGPKPQASLVKLGLSGVRIASFAERFILHPDPILDVSRVVTITLNCHLTLPRILPLLTVLEEIEARLTGRELL